MEFNNKEEILEMITTLERQVEDEKDSQAESSRRINFLLSEIEVHRRSLRNFNEKERALDIEVTDHAVLRYLERVLNIDVEKIRDELLPPAVRKKIVSQGGEGYYPMRYHGVNVRLRVRDNALVTILED